MSLPKNISIYSDTSKEPVLHISKIELSKSKLLQDLLSTLDICDGCQEPISIIIAEEEKETITAAFSHPPSKSSLTTICPMKVLLLLKRLQIIDPRKHEPGMTEVRNVGLELEAEEMNQETHSNKVDNDVMRLDSTADGDIENERDMEQYLQALDQSLDNSFDALSNSIQHLFKRLHPDLPLSSSDQHDIREHLEKEMMTSEDIEMNTCKLCGILIERSRDMVAHMAIVHKKIEIYLPDKEYEKFQSQDIMEHNRKTKVILNKENLPTQDKIFFCKICPKSSGYERVSSLLAHYSLVHYQDKLREFIDKENKICLICGKKAPKVRLLLAHVVSAHNKLQEYLPEEYHQLQMLKKKQRQRLYRQKFKKPGIDQKCKICHKTFKTYRKYDLLRHYSSSHFKANLLPFVDQKSLSCLLCGKKIVSLTQLLLHVGKQHSKLEDYLPEEEKHLLKKRNITKEVSHIIPFSENNFRIDEKSLNDIVNSEKRVNMNDHRNGEKKKEVDNFHKESNSIEVSDISFNSEIEESVHLEIEIKEETESGSGLTVSDLESFVILKEDVADMESGSEVDNFTSSDPDYFMEDNPCENEIRAIFDSDTDNE